MYRTEASNWQSSQKAFIGRSAPFFTGTAVFDNDFKTISLSDYHGKYLVFLFYPNDFTSLCSTDLNTFSDRYDDFKAIDCELLAISTDSKFSHLKWLNISREAGGVEELKYPLLEDPSLQISRDYGMLYEEEGIACRGLIIIDGKGIIRHLSVSDFSVGCSVNETFRLVQAQQYADIHGEVCPANWTPGSKTMKVEVKRRSEYAVEMKD